MGDEPILRDLRLQAIADAPEAFESTRERELARTTADWRRWLAPGATFILDTPSGPRGIVAAAHGATDAAVVNLMAMWVHPEIRGFGAADALVAAVIAWAGAQHARAVRLEVMHSNDRAKRCYFRHGFRLAGQKRRGAATGQIKLVMERIIQESI